MLEFWTDWNEADSYFGVFVLWAFVTVLTLRLAPGLLARVRDDVAPLITDQTWGADRELRRPRWFDEE